MKREEFNKLFPDCDLGENAYTKVVDIKVSNDLVILTQEVDLNHPDCHIVRFEDVTKC